MSGGAPTDDTVVDETLASRRPMSRSTAPIDLGATVGRYVIVSRLGAGAMGVVLAAYDPELDRKVALKLLRNPDRRESGRARLVREAQALARLSHPNVVGVHDVGIHDDQVFVAMEFVDGQTLGSALEGLESRAWSAVRRWFLEAGRGLAAAHGAGLIHRDFKPENVMVDASGRARVMDFGLVRTGEEDEDGDAGDDERPNPVDAEATGSSLSDKLTRTGALLGTPAYMSPEQFIGGTIDARSDQFSYCIALWEALFGQRPFAGDTIATLSLAVATGRRRELPRNLASSVPGHVRRALERGLDPDPELRWRDMESLLAELAADPSVRRRRWVAAGIGVAAIAGTAVLAQRGPEVPRVCQGLDASLHRVWNVDRRAAIASAFEGSGLGHAVASAERSSAILDAYADEWIAGRVDACEATRVRGEQSEALMDLRIACLDRRLTSLDAVVGVLAEGGESSVDKAVRVVSELPRLDTCGDAEALQSETALPQGDADRAKAAEIRKTLARATALGAAGRAREAVVVSEQGLKAADDLGHPPTRVAGLRTHGTQLIGSGGLKEAAPTLEEAFFLAVEHHLYDDAAFAATSLVNLVGYRMSRPDQARRWARHAGAVARGASDPTALGGLAHAVGTLETTQGNPEEAKPQFELALAEARKHAHDGGVSEANSLQALAGVERSLGNYEQAVAVAIEALEIYETLLGPQHPRLAAAHDSLALAYRMQERMDLAVEHGRRALALATAAYGERHQKVASLHNNFGSILHHAGNSRAAEEHYVRSRDLWIELVGEESSDVARAETNLGIIDFDAGRYEEAVAHHLRSLEIREKALGPDNPNLGTPLNNLANTELTLGRPADALRHWQRATELWTKALGADHPHLAYSLTGSGRALLAMNRAGEAVPLLREALKIREAAEHADTLEHAETRFSLARALRGSGGDATEVRKLAESALAGFAASEGGASDVARVRDFLRDAP